MPYPFHDEIDIVEELKLRRWAREHYLPPGQRDSQHPIVAHEMRLRDAEAIIEARSREPVLSYVPLAPSPTRQLHEDHVLPEAPAIMRPRESEPHAETQWLC